GDNNDQTNTIAVSGSNIYGPYDFAYTQSGPLALGDTLYVDWNGDADQDAGEEGIPHITVSLYEDANGDGIIDPNFHALIVTTTTSITGYYLFDDLPQHDYVVVVDEDDPDFPFSPGSYQQTQDYDGTIDGRAVISLTTSVDIVDFGYRPIGTGSIGDFVWRDDDRDGIQDAGEPGIRDILVTLYEDSDSNGVIDPAVDAVVMTATTDLSGNYLFENLPAGDYLVDVDTGDSDLPADGYGNPYILSTNNDPHIVGLTDGQVYALADFGFTAGGTIGDLVWRDDNQDGDPAGEPGIAGVRVWLYADLNGDGVRSITDTLVATTTIGATGIYSFTSQPAGNYVVVVDTTTTPTSTFTYDLNGPLDGQAGVTLSAGQIFLGADFSLPNVNGSIGDRLWIDLNGNDTYETYEPGLAGVVITLTNSSGGVITTSTDADGYYLFSDLTGDTYTATVDTSSLPPGVVQSFEADGTLNQEITVSLGNGENNPNVDFGYVPDLSVSKASSGGGIPLNAGDTLTHTIVVSNPSSATVTGVTISDTTPVNTSFVAGSIVIDPTSAGNPGSPP
ncbi:MAG: DUF11 domain-containing protein, partial [Gemmatimonadota bacterium]